MSDTAKIKPEGLALLRAPFPPNQISKLPKPTKAQTDAVKADFKSGIRCKLCGAWHHKDVVHLDYVGHAALTDRLLDCDPAWNWEPLALAANGAPAIDQNGGLWIKLTVLGVSRLGYGHADGKSGGDAIKEVIGDALRNAAMRFGAALDLWHKGDLHGDEPDEPVTEPPKGKQSKDDRDPVAIADGLIAAFGRAKTAEELDAGKADGTKVAQAWDWLIASHPEQAKRVSDAFAERHRAFAAFITY